jgi:hypothetical protein
MQYYSYEWLDPVMQMGLKQLCVSVNQWKDRLVKTKQKIVILRIKAKIERNYLELYTVWGKDCFFLGATCKRPNGAVLMICLDKTKPFDHLHLQTQTETWKSNWIYDHVKDFVPSNGAFQRYRDMHPLPHRHTSWLDSYLLNSVLLSN